MELKQVLSFKPQPDPRRRPKRPNINIFYRNQPNPNTNIYIDRN